MDLWNLWCGPCSATSGVLPKSNLGFQDWFCYSALYLMEWCSESIGLGAKMPVDFRGHGILPQVWCGHQKWCFCAGVCSQHYEQLVSEVVLVLLLTVSPAFWWCSFLCFGKMEVMRLAFESCVLRSVDRRTQCNLQPESQASIALDFLKWTGLLWK